MIGRIERRMSWRPLAIKIVSSNKVKTLNCVTTNKIRKTKQNKTTRNTKYDIPIFYLIHTEFKPMSKNMTKNINNTCLDQTWSTIFPYLISFIWLRKKKNGTAVPLNLSQM